MDQLYLLWFLSISMLLGSFLSGLVPLSFKLSDRKSRLLALLGSGILVGTALAIIIPEGIDSLYNGNQSPNIVKSARFSNDVRIHISTSTEVSTAISDDNDKETHANRSSKTWTIGVSLIVGFVLMLLIEQFSMFQSVSERPLNSEHDHSHVNYTLAGQDDGVDISSEEVDEVIDDMHTKSDMQPMKSSDSTNRVVLRVSENTSVQMNANPNRYYDHSRAVINRTKINKVTPTLGLLIHAAADGIALGAAATTPHRDIEMIIFFAIMLHKAPAAFSLVVLLIHQGLKHTTIRRHLLAFSFSAPIAALLTYYGLSQSGKEALKRNNATGIAMLFSAGTFLYVATVHVLPDLVHNKLLSIKELGVLICGAFLPLLLAQTI